ncbi:MAG: GNAT family N-acetyltransferase [Thermomicrobiales bacterium]
MADRRAPVPALRRFGVMAFDGGAGYRPMADRRAQVPALRRFGVMAFDGGAGYRPMADRRAQVPALRRFGVMAFDGGAGYRPARWPIAGHRSLRYDGSGCDAMTAGFTIRPYHPRDETGLLAVWNSALFADPINATTFRAKVLLDPNFDRETCLVAENRGEVAGFALGLRRRVPFFGDGYQPDESWISAFGVAPQHQGQGIGSALLEQVLAKLQELGAKAHLFSLCSELLHSRR